MFGRFIATAAAVVTLGFGGFLTAGAASAATSQGPFYSNGNTVVNENGTDYFGAESASYNGAVEAVPSSTFYDEFTVSSSGPNSVRFTLNGTDLCAADPGPGYGNVDNIILRTCNGLQWQAFRYLSEGNNLYALQSVATNQYITDNGQYNELTGDADNRGSCEVGLPCPVGTVGQNTFNGEEAQEWSFGNVTPTPSPTHHRFFEVSATETSSPVTGKGLSGDSADNTVVVTNNSSVNQTVTVTDEASISGTVYVGSGAANSALNGCTFNVSESNQVVGVTDSVQTLASDSSATFDTPSVGATFFDGATVTLATGQPSSCTLVPANAGDLVSDIGTGTVVVDLNVVETPTVTDGTFNVHVNPVSETTNFTS